MHTKSEHAFGDGELRVSISEVMKEDYGLYVWPSSVALAEYVWQQKHRFSTSNVLELGAGTGLPGIVAAKLGATVTLTDRSDSPEVLANLRKTCELNNVRCKIMGLTWGEWDEDLLQIGPPQIILGADVLYDNQGFDDLFATVSFLLAGDARSVFVTTYECRSGHRSIEYLMAKWSLSCTKLVDVRAFLPEEKQAAVSTSILLVEMKLAAASGAAPGAAPAPGTKVPSSDLS